MPITMPRPRKCRRVRFLPRSSYFKPAGIPVSELEAVPLTLDESEALRLADWLGLEQEEAAASMKVSRQTFGNILRSARAKTADAITNGKALRIEGGAVLLTAGKCGRRRAAAGCPRRSEKFRTGD